MPALAGELSFASVPNLLERLDALAADSALDMSAVDKADSAGLALLLELTRRARAGGRQLTLAGVRAQVRDLIRFFDLDCALKMDEPA